MSFEQQQQQQQPEQIGANKAENVTAGESGMTVQAPNTNGVQRTSSISSDSSAIEPAGPTDPSLPGRFRAAGQWKYSKKNQHPMYQTSSSTYGAKAPTDHEMPLKYFGLNGKFTKKHGNPSRRATLNF